MREVEPAARGRAGGLDALDRVAVGYLALPLVIFVAGWLEPWAALVLLACLAYALGPLAAPGTAGSRIPREHLAVAAAVGCLWTVFGGTGHLVFANADWTVRDAVLHDLVAGGWPVGYGPLDGEPSLLRAPLGYYLPAALIGKAAGLTAAHAALAIWTALGASLFLLQVLSRTVPPTGSPHGAAGAQRVKVIARALAVVLVIVAFSGLDVVGTLLRDPGARAHWDITSHLEWWAARYQYSSMTTQLFWVPNHALCGWVAVGLLCRQRPQEQQSALDALLPLLVVAVALWSPLTALGLVPFVLWRVGATLWKERSWRPLDPRLWAPSLIVGLIVAAYLTLDAGRIPKGVTYGHHGLGAAALLDDAWRQLEFFFLEAGLVGFAILAIRRSAGVALALSLLAVLPALRFGAANDLVMRASIPSLAVLAIGACVALTAGRGMRVRRGMLILVLAVGAVTPFQEFARAAVLPRWPIDRVSTLIVAACGRHPAHYIARLDGQAITRLLREPQTLPAPRLTAAQAVACDNPALLIEARRAGERR